MRVKPIKVILFAVIVCILLIIFINGCTCRRQVENVEAELPKIDFEPEIKAPKETAEIEDVIELEKPIVVESEESKETPIIEPTPTEEVVREVEEKPQPEIVSLGEFRLTAYCPCVKCCGKWSGGATASGVMPTANHTIAVDRNVIPFGTEIIINGITYVAEDTGSAIKGNRIDIYFDSHQEALIFGVQYAEVFKIVY